MFFSNPGKPTSAPAELVGDVHGQARRRRWVGFCWESSSKVVYFKWICGEYMVCVWIIYGESMDMVDMPSGNDYHSHWKWPSKFREFSHWRIMIFHRYVNVLPEGISSEIMVPSGERSHNYGKSFFFMGKPTISTGPFSIAMFDIVKLSEGNSPRYICVNYNDLTVLLSPGVLVKKGNHSLLWSKLFRLVNHQY